MAQEEITRITNFSIKSHLENINYGIPCDNLIESDLLLLPFRFEKTNSPPAFLIGSYDRLLRFKDDYKSFNVQPVFNVDVKPNFVVFNDINIYLGTFIATSIIAPIFVNWLSAMIISNNNKDVNINIVINVYDKGDDICTRFKHYDNIDNFRKNYVKEIEEYSYLKKQGKVKTFDEKYLGKTIDLEV